MSKYRKINPRPQAWELSAADGTRTASLPCNA